MFWSIHKYWLWDIKESRTSPANFVHPGCGAPRWDSTCNRVRVMSSYAKYCRDQAAECARRARLASSPDIAANSRTLELRWLKLAEKARMPGRLGNGKRATVTMGTRT